jgi:hypothetical protein
VSSISSDSSPAKQHQARIPTTELPLTIAGPTPSTSSSLIKAASWLEIIVGAVLIQSVNLLSRLLFAAAPQGVGGPLGRVAGIAIFSLGIASLRSTEAGLRGSAVLDLLIYNAGVAIFYSVFAIDV